MSRDCDYAVEVIYSYLDREMRWYRRVKVERHLRRCPPCSDAFAFEDRLKLLVKERCQEQLPGELLDRLRAVIRQDPPGL